MWVFGLDWTAPGQRQVADACECGNELSGSVKCEEVLDQLQTSQLLKNDSAPCSKCRSHITSLRFGHIVINDCRILNTYNGKKKTSYVSGAHPKFFSGGAGDPKVISFTFHLKKKLL